MLCCVGDTFGTGGQGNSSRTVSMGHIDRVIDVGLIWVLFERYTSKLCGHNQGNNMVHAEWSIMT